MLENRQFIIQQHHAGQAIRNIARENGISRNAVRRALAENARMEYWRPSATEDYEPAVRDVLADYPHMSVPDIAVMIDWPKSRRTLSDMVASLRPEYIERHESEATSMDDVLARPMHSLRAGALQLPAVLAVGDIDARELTVQEVTWWTELEKQQMTV